jgi:hypothetical protein
MAAKKPIPPRRDSQAPARDEASDATESVWEFGGPSEQETAEDLGGRMLAELILITAAHCGIPPNEITEQFAEVVRRCLPHADVRSARDAPVATALRLAARGDFMAAGDVAQQHFKARVEAVVQPRIIEQMAPDAKRGRKLIQGASRGGLGKRKAFADKDGDILEEAARLKAQYGRRKPSNSELALKAVESCRPQWTPEQQMKKADSIRRKL